MAKIRVVKTEAEKAAAKAAWAAFWCSCKVETPGAIYHADGTCPTCHKHHWHCPACHKIVQVG